MKSIKTFLITFAIPITLFSQSISGYVGDHETGTKLPYTNISIAGTNSGTTTNADGYFQMKLRPGLYKLLFQHIGYTSHTAEIIIENEPLTLNVKLHSQVLPMNAVTVYANQRSDVELLIMKAASQKQKTLSLIKNYRCKSYTKTSYQSARKKRNVYGGIFENYSELFYNAPSQWHEQVLSQKQTANIPKTVGMVSGNTFLNINSDRIHLGKKNIIGPTAADAIDHYHYEIIDTLYQDELIIYNIQFRPENNKTPSMHGSIYLVDGLFVIKKIDARLNTQCNYDVFEDIHIVQTYRTIEDSIFVPEYSLRECTLKIDIPRFPEIIMCKQNYREDYNINSDANFITPGAEAVNFKVSMPFDSVKMNFPPLTGNEIKAYARIDSLVKNNKTIRMMTAVLKLMDSYSYISSLPIGEFSDFFHYNRVEGNFFGISLDSKRLFNSFSCSGGYGYGLSDKRSKYFIKSALTLDHKNMRLAIKGEMYKSIHTREDRIKYPIHQNSYSSLFKAFDYYDYYYAKGYTLSTSFSINHFELSSKYINEQHSIAETNLQTSLLSKKAFASNPSILPGKYRGINLSLDYSNRSFHNSHISKKMIPNQNFLDMQCSIHAGIPGLGSDFNFKKYNLSIYSRFNVYATGSLDATLMLGFSQGSLPPQFLFELESGHTGYRIYKAFATLNPNVFIGTKKCAAFLEHNSHDSIFKLLHLPIPWDLSIIFNLGWAGFEANTDITHDMFYSETGFGINKIFNLIKFEFVWRLRHVPDSKSFCITMKIDEFDVF
ncbi:carboxypeptidase-like regulatory domain-containing protein [bacterium]|nr:carboxypeptidase-like regulatory domain-containing protein [bacterium]